jgi:small subunit ribosomal protein S20
MANSNSQRKRIRQDHKRHLRNKAVRSELKTRVRAAVAAAQAGDADAAAAALRVAQERIDTAVSKGVLHRNTAARRKSRLTRRVVSLLES